jgi:phenylalanyl-tRNA synthetase alpha chain
MSDTNLNEMINTLVGALLPGATERRQPRSHPYTVGGCQVDIAHDGRWVEIAEGGLAHAGVLARAGLDSSYSGLALGMGLDRLLMLLKAIPDIRVLRATDPAITTQMTDLSPYRPVSAMPPIRRDISLVVDGDDLVEDLGDRVRDALGNDAACVELVDILQQTPCSALPAHVLVRLGARRDQKNLLIRVVLRHLDKTLSNQEANVVRDRIYAALHQGTAQQWASFAHIST